MLPIINGVRVKFGDIMVQLVSNNVGFCGGTIVSSKVALTSAHCVYNLPKMDLQLRHNGTKSYSVDSITIHPEFKVGSFIDDLAIIEPDQPIYSNRLVKISKALPDQEIVVAGWGSKYPGGSSSPSTLLGAKLSVVSDSDTKCLTKYHPKLNLSNRDKIFCAEDPTGVHDACWGDSGGPALLVSSLSTKVIEQVGIISYGQGCGNPGTPSIYTRLDQYLDWIDRFILSQV